MAWYDFIPAVAIFKAFTGSGSAAGGGGIVTDPQFLAQQELQKQNTLQNMWATTLQTIASSKADTATKMMGIQQDTMRSIANDCASRAVAAAADAQAQLKSTTQKLDQSAGA